ncbi:hypothetical protein [Roseateles sp. LKC17W]|uniref:DUF3108 domain-containing protein n=1 Tax=Pelomonas margarita TaxID=3299031 RepID=A0ABW7FPW5_9BURK
MRARPTLPRAAWLMLAASVLAHVALLGDPPERPDRQAPARAVSIALLPPAVLPIARLEPAAPVPPATARPARPSPLARAEPPPAPTPLADTHGPLLQLAGPASWRYRLRQGGQDGEALLDWRPEADGRYSLRLTRRIGERALPALESLGRTGTAGLAPERFALQRGGRDRQAVNFDLDDQRISFSASTAHHEMPAGAQDRLSWWLQLAALVQAAPTPGGRWRVWVAGLRGELREWVFEAQDSGPEAAGLLHLRRLRLGEHDPGIELWLDPARGYWPARLRQGDPEMRGYEIVLADVNS